VENARVIPFNGAPDTGVYTDAHGRERAVVAGVVQTPFKCPTCKGVMVRKGDRWYCPKCKV